MSVLKNKLIVPHGTMKVEGVTFYQRKGTTVMRSASSQQPHRRTSRQFEARQRMANCTALWKALRAATEPVLHGGKSSYGRFCTLMRKLPVAYLTKDERLKGAALLMPGMPVSDGMLPDIECQLGQVEGRPALLTSLRLSAGARTIPSLLYGPRAELKKSERLCLFRLRQRMPESDPEAVPRVAVRVEMLDIENCRDREPFAGIELMDVDGRLALVGDTLGDDTMGWALVRMDGDNVSSQRVAASTSSISPTKPRNAPPRVTAASPQAPTSCPTATEKTHHLPPTTIKKADRSMAYSTRRIRLKTWWVSKHI